VVKVLATFLVAMLLEPVVSQDEADDHIVGTHVVCFCTCLSDFVISREQEKSLANTYSRSLMDASIDGDLYAP